MISSPTKDIPILECLELFSKVMACVHIESQFAGLNVITVTRLDQRGRRLHRGQGSMRGVQRGAYLVIALRSLRTQLLKDFAGQKLAARLPQSGPKCSVGESGNGRLKVVD